MQSMGPARLWPRGACSSGRSNHRGSPLSPLSHPRSSTPTIKIERNEARPHPTGSRPDPLHRHLPVRRCVASGRRRIWPPPPPPSPAGRVLLLHGQHQWPRQQCAVASRKAITGTSVTSSQPRW
ncbi:hypothetical protein PAHAL_7G271700 [Panicum hallii]|uniref:Uncharacterized protein n=1 Tax=Panicum hallii TaxID=206008 RepID=A0A2S3IAF1_9POAL|nr:hypothetical protein PAHAL_7G271700 [Panicum hallii]